MFFRHAGGRFYEYLDDLITATSIPKRRNAFPLESEHISRLSSFWNFQGFREFLGFSRVFGGRFSIYPYFRDFRELSGFPGFSQISGVFAGFRWPIWDLPGFSGFSRIFGGFRIFAKFRGFRGFSVADLGFTRVFTIFVNFRGFPDIPGEDWLASTPLREATNTGGSRR